jgi:aminopeptidase N
MDRIVLPGNVIPLHYQVDITPRLEALAFKAKAIITVRVLESTSTIVMNSVELEFSSIELRGSIDLSGVAAIDLSNQRVTFQFDQLISPGEYDLTVDYSGKINESAEGLFITKYGTPDGEKQLLLTQFEAVAARRFMPCWDEPGRKATFTIGIVITSVQTAISNMPIERVDASVAGLRYVRFMKSPIMSCYLLFICVGELDRLETNTGDVVVSVVARKGSAYKGQFALESATRLLEFYNDYFATPYPLPKLDLIAAPGAGGFSAMENWGAILYFEKSLLFDPQLSSESDRQRIFVVVAHEMAHQWFGNLVTMEWWDNLWLNEGFASWMENKATDRFHPEWAMWIQSESARQLAMRQDSKKTTHPVVQEVQSGEQADQAFDNITYRKGQAVIRMLENYVGEDIFRQGVRQYMKQHAYSNTTTDDLWAEITEAGGRNIKTIADDFTLQPGVPLINVQHATQDSNHTKLLLSQERFGLDSESQQPLIWHTPVSAASVLSNVNTTIVTSEAGPIELTVNGDLPVKINLHQTAYYRSKYSDDTFSKLAEQFWRLEAIDQIGLLYDTWALGEAGFMPVSRYLDLTKLTDANADALIWRQIIETLLSIDSLYAGLGGRTSLQSYAVRLLKPVFAQVTWDRRPGEPDNVAVLREDLVYALGRMGDQDLIAEARRRVLNFITNPGDPLALPAAIRRATLRVVACWADLEMYDKIYQLAKGSMDPVAKDQYFVALASAISPDLARRSLEIALSDGPAKTTAPSMIFFERTATQAPGGVAVDNADMAWTFVIQHLSEVTAKLDAVQRYNFIPSVGAQSLNPVTLQELRKFIDENVPATNRPQVERYYADMAFRLSVRDQRVPEIDSWIKANG